MYGALTGAAFLLSVVLQVVSGYSPLGSGLARLQLSAGPLVVGVGLALLMLTPSGSSYVLYVLPAVTVFGLGLAITVAPLTAAAMSSAPADHSGIASAVNNDVARFGGLLAVAVTRLHRPRPLARPSRKLADLQQVQAQGFDLSQDAVKGSLVQYTGQDRLGTPPLPRHRRER